MDRRTFIRASLLALTGGTAVTAVAGCGGSGQQDQAATDTVRVAALGNPTDALDVGSATGLSATVACFAIWDSLVELTADGVRPQLAQELTPNSGGTEWTVRLRPATFQNGDPVTAADVLASLQAMADSPNYGSFYSEVDFGASRVADPSTVVLVLTRPRGDLVEAVFSQASPVMLRGDASNRIGAGPFAYVSGDPQSGYVLQRYDGYHGGPPPLQRLEVRSVDDGTARVQAVESGSIDYAVDLPATGAATMSRAVTVSGGLSGAKGFALELNTRLAPFDDPEVRRAVKMALDRPRLVQIALGEGGQIGNDLIGLGLPGYDESIPQRERDLDTARRIFAEKGVGALTLRSADIVTGMDAASELMIGQFAEAGVTLTVERVDAGAFYEDMEALQSTPFFVGYYLNRPVAATLPFQTAADATWNFSGFSTPQYAAILEQAMSTVDPARRTELYLGAQRILHDEGGTVLWGFKEQSDGARDGLTDVTAVQGVPTFPRARYA